MQKIKSYESHIEINTMKKLDINDVRVSTIYFAYFFVQIQIGCQESGHNYPDFLDAAHSLLAVG